MQETDYKVWFARKYFNGGKNCNYDINKVDIVLKDKKGNAILYIESKHILTNPKAILQARAQIILTNKQQENTLSQVALIYKDKTQSDFLELIECDDSVMHNNDINWKKETPSNPSKDAIDRINDRLINKIKIYKDDEVKELYPILLKGQNEIQITLNNCILVYNEWKYSVKFQNEIKNEQDYILLFLADALNGANYKKATIEEMDVLNYNELSREVKKDLIVEGTRLKDYHYIYSKDGIATALAYSNLDHYYFKNPNAHADFWKKYKRPPNKNEFLKIIEHSAKFYSDKYRKTTGGEYTPSCFVKLQNEILAEHLGEFEKDYIVFDPCAGVGNLENNFSKEYKRNCCYLSTLEQIDVDTCKIKGFGNSVCFDYLKDSSEPLFDYNGKKHSIKEICQKEKKKLMVIMNPPYQKAKGRKNNLAIEFFNKVLKLSPEIIVFYCMTESFLRNEIKHYLDSGYKILSHSFSNAKTTFLLSEWSISQVIFSKNQGEILQKDKIVAKRYELEKKQGEEVFNFKRVYTYDLKRPSLLKEIDKAIKENQGGMVLGNYSYLNSTIKIGNGGQDKGNKVTTQNLQYALLSKGLNFNTHHKYFELNDHCFKGKIKDIPQELFNDCIAFSLFFKGNLFSNNQQIITESLPPKNYIMPFSAEQLGCGCNKGNLNVLEAEDATIIRDVLTSTSESTYPPFDFREFLGQFEFSKEAKNLFESALEIFRFYHKNKEYENKDFNDSFYDITNAIMSKIPSDFRELESKNDTRISKTKTTKGTRGFGRNTIKSVVNSEFLPIFYHFFDTRDILAKKINKQLLSANLLLWERENIY